MISCIFICAVFIISCSSAPTETPTTEQELTVHQMILNGQTANSKDLFQSRVDVNLQDENGNTPLHIAAQVNNSDMAVFLLTQGALTEIQNNAGDTPLFTAIRNNSYETARDLVQMDANIFARDVLAKTAFEAAIQNADFFDAIITPKTGLLHDENGNTITHYATLAENTAAIEFIINKKLPVSDKNNAGEMPLDTAFKKNNSITSIHIAALLIQGNATPTYGEFDYFERAIKTRNTNLRFSDGQTPLQAAAIRNHPAVITYLLNNGASINTKDVSGATALHYAVRNSNTQIVQELLIAGADTNSPDSSSKTPLLRIISTENRVALYNLLLTYGANPNAKDIYGDTALHVATMLNAEVEVLQMLINAGADVNERNKKGSSPIAVAIETKNSQHTAFYARTGADIHSENLDSLTPLMRALKAEQELFRACITPQNISTRDSYGNTVLHVAVKERAATPYIEYLLESGADINTQNKVGDSPLYIAVDKNFKDIGELLLAQNADVFATNAKNFSPLHIALQRGGATREWVIVSSVIEATDSTGNTPLHYAALWQFNESINYLLQKGAHINERNANGETALFTAVQAESPTTIAILINSGIDSEIRDFLGNTALHASARWGSEKAAVALIQNGANINAQNVAGKTPLAEALRIGALDMALLYLDNGANCNIPDSLGKTALIDAIQVKNLNGVQLLLEYNALTTVQDMYGRNAYHEAVLSGEIALINLIASTGANPFARDFFGETPFSLSLNASPEIIQAVLGMQKDIMDSDGNTPIHIAVAKKAPNATLSLLIDLGYPLDTRNSAGLTPLLSALELGEYEAALSLLNAGADPYIADQNGNNPVSLLLLAKKENSVDFVRAIGTKTDISGDGILHYAARIADVESVELLLSLGLDKYILNISGETPYDIANRWQRPEIARLLQ